MADLDNSPAEIEEIKKSITTLKAAQSRIEELEELIADVQDQIDERVPETLLLSKNLISRSLTVWGYDILGGIILGVVVYGCVFIFGISLSFLN